LPLLAGLVTAFFIRLLLRSLREDELVMRRLAEFSELA
jgi:hypothetical protein